MPLVSIQNEKRRRKNRIKVVFLLEKDDYYGWGDEAHKIYLSKKKKK